MNERPVVVNADRRWPAQFIEIATSLRPFLDETVLRIEHVGSTSVAGLVAKPIIDVDVVVASEEDIAPAIPLIESAGYQWVGNLDVEGREAFDAPIGSTLATHHLYLVVENNRAHADHWLFRDALIANASTRDQYAELKRVNAVRAQGDLDRYVALKAAFVAEVLARARRERGLEPVQYWQPEVD